MTDIPKPLLICRAMLSRCDRWPKCRCGNAGKDPKQGEPWKPKP